MCSAKSVQLADGVAFERLDDQALRNESLRRQILQLPQDEVGAAQTEGESEQLVQHACVAEIDSDVGIADVDPCH